MQARREAGRSGRPHHVPVVHLSDLLVRLLEEGPEVDVVRHAGNVQQWVLDRVALQPPVPRVTTQRGAHGRSGRRPRTAPGSFMSS